MEASVEDLSHWLTIECSPLYLAPGVLVVECDCPTGCLKR